VLSLDLFMNYICTVYLFGVRRCYRIYVFSQILDISTIDAPIILFFRTHLEL